MQLDILALTWLPAEHGFFWDLAQAGHGSGGADETFRALLASTLLEQEITKEPRT